MRFGSRAMRYAHEAGTQLGVTKPDLALLSELLCRGPQAPGALKTRCSRMHPFGSADEVEELVDEPEPERASETPLVPPSGEDSADGAAA